MRLRTRYEYQRMARGSQRFVGRWMIIDVRLNGQVNSKLGITVTRRYGKAHERNRFKRLIREAFRSSYPSLPKGLDIIVRPRSLAASAMMQEVQVEMSALIKAFEESRHHH